MNSQREIVVLKFGSSVLADETNLASVVGEIERYWRRGAQVIAVVSAFGETTDHLIRQAHSICDRPEPSSGKPWLERQSNSLPPQRLAHRSFRAMRVG